MRRWPGFLDALFFYGLLPFRVRRLVRRFRPGAVIAESPYIGFFVLLGTALRRRDRPSVVVETHGDWRSATRLGGSRLRLLFAPLADWAARYALRHADALRAVSPFTAELAGREAGVPPVESFPAYIDLGAFTGRPPAPLPRTPTLVFVGMLERSKGVEALADAWRYVAGRVPEARLVVVGRGALRDVVDRLRDDYPGRVEHVEELPPQGVAERMDDAMCLVLPSRSEGLGRVILEAFARGRAVVATRVGGIPDLVEDDVNGLLVENGDVAGLADALHADPDRGRARCPARRGRVQGLADVRVVARRLRGARALAGRPDAGRGAPLMRLVFVTQSVDAEDPILGATVAKLRALAQRCDELVVITDHVGAHDLPPNCTLRTFGSRTKLGRGLRYMQVLVPQLLRRDRPDAVIAHMCPIYLVLAAPLAKAVRVPLALWYTHWTIDRTLKLATRLADVGLSVDRRSYPIADPKVLGIGHGIDVSQFGAREARAGRQRHAAAARARQDVAVEGVPDARQGVRARPRAGGRPPGRDPRGLVDGRGAAAPGRARGTGGVGRARRHGGARGAGAAPGRSGARAALRRRGQHDAGADVGRRARQGGLRVGSVRRARLRVQSLLRRVSQRSPASSSTSGATTQKIWRASSVRSRRATRAAGTPPAESCAAASRPATPSTAGRTRSSRRCAGSTTDRCGCSAATWS